MVSRMNLSVLHILRFVKLVLSDFFFKNNGLLLASAVAYNTMLSLIPLAAVLVVLFSQFIDQKLLMEAITTEVGLIAPKATPMLIDVVETFLESRELAGWIGVVVLLFFSSIAFRVLENAFAIIFHFKEPPVKRSFWISALIPYLFIAMVAGGLIVITAITAVIEATAGRTFTLGGVKIELHWLANSGLHIAGFACVILLFTTLYKVMPVTKISFRLALSGGVTAAILWEILRAVLIGYFSSLSLVNAVYGSMATTIILLLTIEAAALIVLLGAQVIAELQRGIDRGIPWYKEQ